MRSSSKSLPRFSGEDFLTLSSVKRTQNLQLNSLPCWLVLTRLLVEPLAYGCQDVVRPLKNIVAGSLCPCSLSTDSCVLPLTLLVVVYLLCVLLGTRFNSDLIEYQFYELCYTLIFLNISALRLKKILSQLLTVYSANSQEGIRQNRDVHGPRCSERHPHLGTPWALSE
jgi:hypothetical protein